MFADVPGRLLTAGVIAELTGYPPARVRSVIRQRKISPWSRAGTVYVFDDAAAAEIVEELDAIEASRALPRAEVDGAQMGLASQECHDCGIEANA